MENPITSRALRRQMERDGKRPQQNSKPGPAGTQTNFIDQASATKGLWFRCGSRRGQRSNQS